MRREVLQATDSRIKLTSEILTGLRTIKSNSWEVLFLKNLSLLRNQELAGLSRSAIYRASLVSVLSAAPSFVAVFTLAVYACLGNILNPAKVFSSLSLFNQLRFPLMFFPMLLNTLAEGKVSLKRLTEFLMAEEQDNYVERVKSFEESHLAHAAVVVEKGIFSWNKFNLSTPSSSLSLVSKNESIVMVTEEEKRKEWFRGRLDNVTLTVDQGELVGVVGATGSGKTSLLISLLGELHKQQGRVRVRGDVAYVSQLAWLPNESIRDVILFGREFDAEKYNRCLQVCGLDVDIAEFNHGDMTKVGEQSVAIR